MNKPKIPDYKMAYCCGSGGYGDVWLAEDHSGLIRAVKLLEKERLRKIGLLHREEKALSLFRNTVSRHPNLIEIFHVGETSEYLYYVMEPADNLLEGNEAYLPATCSEIIRKFGAFSFDKSIEFTEMILNALECLHEAGLTHRDIKPSNIIYINHEPKLADIGLTASVSHDISLAGTIGFIPPEGQTGKASDLYSMGKLLYCIFSGQPVEAFPTLPDTLCSSPAQIAQSKGINEIILKACNSDQRKRFKDVAEFRSALIKARIKKKESSLLGHWNKIFIAFLIFLVVFLTFLLLFKNSSKQTLAVSVEKKVTPSIQNSAMNKKKQFPENKLAEQLVSPQEPKRLNLSESFNSKTEKSSLLADKETASSKDETQEKEKQTLEDFKKTNINNVHNSLPPAKIPVLQDRNIPAVELKNSKINLLSEFSKGKWKICVHGRGSFKLKKGLLLVNGTPGGSSDFGWSYDLPKLTQEIKIEMIFKMSPYGAFQLVFERNPRIIEGVGVALSFKWFKGLSVGNLSSRGSDMKTIPFQFVKSKWHKLQITVSKDKTIKAILDKNKPVFWKGDFTPYTITFSGDETMPILIKEFQLRIAYPDKK